MMIPVTHVVCGWLGVALRGSLVWFKTLDPQKQPRSMTRCILPEVTPKGVQFPLPAFNKLPALMRPRDYTSGKDTTILREQSDCFCANKSQTQLIDVNDSACASMLSGSAEELSRTPVTI
jgi:hypothetical protein